MISAYEVLARLLGTKPIRVRLAADAFTFHCGSTAAHVRPLVWCSDPGAKGKVVAVGDEPPPVGALSVDLTSRQAMAFSAELRQHALKAVLVRGFQGLAREATIQRPEVIVENDVVLADAFDGQHREALRRAVSSAGAVGIRFA